MMVAMMSSIGRVVVVEGMEEERVGLGLKIEVVIDLTK